jgi:hypothetical protein
MTLRTSGAGMAAIGAGLMLLVSCSEPSPRSHLQENIAEKSLFEGEWYYSWTVIDNRYTGTASDTLGTYVGDTSSDFGAGWAVARIRWVIDEDYLYAFRTHELVRGSNPDAEEGNWDSDGDGESDSYRGEPVAAFAIKSHFDIRRAYNATTGEEYNVITENTDDRRWFERDYMRVDWSVNHIMGYNIGILDIYSELLGLGSYEPTPMFAQMGSDTPDNWKPVFAFTPDQRPCPQGGAAPGDCSWQDQHISEFWDEHGPDEMYYMSFVTQEMLSPGAIQDPFTGGVTLYCQSVYSDSPYCTSTIIVKRHAFLRISPDHDYAPALHADNDFERFGLFRVERQTYDTVDPDDPADSRLGQTDFLDYHAVLHNIWQRHHDDAGNVLPHSQREPRPQHVWLTSGFPSYLVRTGLGVAAEWGEVFMSLVRANQGREQPYPYYIDSTCSTNDECLAAYGPDSDHRTTCDQAVGKCRRPYNPFRAPKDFYEGDYDCYIGLADGSPAPPDPMGQTPHDPDNPLNPASKESDFDGDLQLVFNGSECMIVAHVNSCDRDPGLPCEERGDMRYRFFSFVFSADTPFLGVATMRGDPVTGEMVTGDANFASWDMGWYRTRALQEYDIVNGTLSEEELMLGEDVRGMADQMGRTIAPVRPLRDEQLQLEGESAFPVGFSRDMIDQRWGQTWQRAQQLRGDNGRQATFSHRLRSLRGSEIERMLFDNTDSLVLAGVRRLTPEVVNQPVPEEIMERVSPFRTRASDAAEMSERWALRRAHRGECFAESNFNDYSVRHFVEEHKDYTRQQLTFALDRSVLSETELHEFGHVLGLRHNFTGTVDIHNFHPEYHEIVRNHPMPTCTDHDLSAGRCVGPNPENMGQNMNYDENGDGRLSRTEMYNLTQAQAHVRRDRELAGMEQYWTSSLMDYTPAWYHRLTGLGKYDKAAVLFNYGRLVEVYDRSQTSLAADRLNSADGERVLWRYYSGGESCSADTDCPYSAQGQMSPDLMESQVAAGVFQRCLANPRFENGWGVCSNTYEDLEALNGAGNDSYVAVNYRFCTDERVADQSDCNRMDEGASYREIVMNLRENYHRQYFWNNFRRYRRNFPGSYGYRVVSRILQPLANIYHHMYYRYASEGEEYRNNTGPLGFYDQYMASVDVMNFMAEILVTPNVGVYYADNYSYPGTERLIHWEENLDWADVPWDLKLFPGQGKYYMSDYRMGITGIHYVERLGVIVDKIYAIQMLASRDTGLPYLHDSLFYVNFYDAFPEEMSYLFGNFATDQTGRLLPRITVDDNDRPTLHYLDLWDGDRLPRAGEKSRPAPDADFAGMAIVDDESNFYQQYYALIESLANFPVQWDASWERQLRLYTVGGEDGIDVIDCAEEPGEEDCLVAGEDYVKYTSDRFHRSYVAFAVEPDPQGQRGESYMFSMLREANDLQDRIAEIQACAADDPNAACGFGPMPPLSGTGADTRDYLLRRLQQRLNSVEGYIRYVLQVQREYGINVVG